MIYSEGTTKLKWTVESYRRYLDLYQRNYHGELWGDDEDNPSAEYCEFTEMEQFFQCTNNTQNLLKAYDSVVADYKGCQWHVNRVADDSLAYKNERDKLTEQVVTLFDAIKHGDDEHQLWLKNKIDEHFGIDKELK
jgi:hypothetical protein